MRRALAGLAAVLALTACGVGPDPTPDPAAAAAAAAPPAAAPPAPSGAPSAALAADGSSPPSVAGLAALSAAASSPPSAVRPAAESSAPSAAARAATTAEPAPPTVPVADPVSLSVPSVGIDSTLVELGRNADGTVEVPSLDDPDAKPGWYRGSPAPGALGPAIILGHVDSRRFGPGVFYDLKDVVPGDPVDVGRADGTVAHFIVDAVREVAKSDFPTLAVYGNIDHAGLRLITCGGVFDPDARSYESNVIVFASLVG